VTPRLILWLPPLLAAFHIGVAVLAHVAVLAGFVGAARFLPINPWVSILGVTWAGGIIVWRIVTIHRSRHGTRIQHRRAHP